jgi:hypothetical protein
MNFITGSRQLSIVFNAFPGPFCGDIRRRLQITLQRPVLRSATNRTGSGSQCNL